MLPLLPAPDGSNGSNRGSAVEIFGPFCGRRRRSVAIHDQHRSAMQALVQVNPVGKLVGLAGGVRPEPGSGDLSGKGRHGQNVGARPVGVYRSGAYEVSRLPCAWAYGVTCGFLGVDSAWVVLPADPNQRIKSPLLPYRIGTPTVGLCRSVRDSAVFDAGVCRVVPDRSMTYEQPPSNHGRQAASGPRRTRPLRTLRKFARYTGQVPNL